MRGRVDFESSSVVSESPNVMDLGMSPSNTTDKLNSVIAPTTRVEGFTHGSNWIASRYDCEEVTVGRVSEAKVFSKYIKNNEFETMKVFEREKFL